MDRPGAIVFDTTPIPMAVRRPLPGLDPATATPRPGAGVSIWIAVPEADALHGRMVAAGIEIVVEPADSPLRSPLLLRGARGLRADPARCGTRPVTPASLTIEHEVRGPWSLATSRRFAGVPLPLPRRARHLLARHRRAPSGDRRGPGGLPGAATPRVLDPAAALARVRTVLGIGPFAAELVVIRGANASDLLPVHEGRVEQEIRLRYGPGDKARRAEAWSPLRSRAAVHLRALREERASTGTGRRAGSGATSAT